MSEIKTSDAIDRQRRRFLGTAAMSIAAAQLGMTSFVQAQAAKTKLPTVKPGTNTSFGAIKQIDAGLLNVGYAGEDCFYFLIDSPILYAPKPFAGGGSYTITAVSTDTPINARSPSTELTLKGVCVNFKAINAPTGSVRSTPSAIVMGNFMFPYSANKIMKISRRASGPITTNCFSASTYSVYSPPQSSV